MNYTNKYFKYKKKYSDLKKKINQIGGNKCDEYTIINKNNNDNIKVISRDMSISIENEINKINTDYLKTKRSLGDFFYNFPNMPCIIELDENDYNIVYIIFKKINYSASKNELDFLNNIYLDFFKKKEPEKENININNMQVIKYEYIDEIPEFLIIDKIDTLLSLLISLNRQSFDNLTLFIIAYYVNTQDLINKRLSYIKSTGCQTPIKIFNEEKIKKYLFYEKLSKIYSLFETIFIKNLELDNSKSNGHPNTGLLTIFDEKFFYKDLMIFEIDVLSIEKIFELYMFVLDCNNMNIDENFVNYNIRFVNVPLKIIFSSKNDFIYVGYLMENVDGYTLRDIKKHFNNYWETNKENIKNALHTLVDKLTNKQFLIVDFNDDNVIWNMNTNTLTYIDISQQSFNSSDRHYRENNSSIHGFISLL
jgi:hypothetical protein